MPRSISRAAPHELLPALRLLFPEIADLPADELGSTAVFVARDSAGVDSAMLVQTMPGALGVAWPPCAATPETADSLVAEGCRWLKSRGAKVCQAFAAGEEASRMAPLERNGFNHVTQLVSLSRGVVAGTPQSSLAFEADSPPFTKNFLATTLATHVDTLDCPELNGDRTESELLACFTDALPGATWHLARRESKAVGVVMLAPGTDSEAIEITYLGVVPEARRRGLGAELLAFVFSESAQRGANTIEVAVDAKNELALKLYRRHGFIETGRREVWLAQLNGPEKDSTTSSFFRRD